MKLVQIYPIKAPFFTYKCKGCGFNKTADYGHMADLDGDPFDSYYCPACSDKIKKRDK